VATIGVVAAAGNQTQVVSTLQSHRHRKSTAEQFTDAGASCNRVTCRIVSVFDDIRNIDSDWVRGLTVIDRIGIRSRKVHQIKLIITFWGSLTVSAAHF